MSTQEPMDHKDYFSIEDHCICRIQPVEASLKQLAIQRLHQGLIDYPNKERLYLGLETEIHEKLLKLKNSHALMHDILEILNRKMNLIASSMPSETRDPLMDQVPEAITLSAVGIRCLRSKPMPVGQDCQLELVLLPNQIYLLIYGHVLACEPVFNEDERSESAGEWYTITFDFDGIREEDSERLIQHILRLEAQRIRQSKQPE